MATRLRIVLLLTCLTLLASCSRLDLGYRNLDWLIPWSLDNYIPLSAEQKTWLKPRLITHINWHCTTQLPLYSNWLQRSAELAVAPDPAPAGATRNSPPSARPLTPLQCDSHPTPPNCCKA